MKTNSILHVILLGCNYVSDSQSCGTTALWIRKFLLLGNQDIFQYSCLVVSVQDENRFLLLLWRFASLQEFMSRFDSESHFYP